MPNFIAARTRTGAPLLILNVADEYARVALGCRVDRSIGAAEVIAELDRLFARHGRPRLLRSDNGREFIAASLADLLRERGVRQASIENGSPQQNPYVERCNGTMRDELLNGEEFDNPLEAGVVIAGWVEHYNRERPQCGLGMMTPVPMLPAAVGRSVRATTADDVDQSAAAGTGSPGAPGGLQGRGRSLRRIGPNTGRQSLGS